MWNLDEKRAGGSITLAWESAAPLLGQRNCITVVCSQLLSDLSREGLWEVEDRVTGFRWEQDVGDGSEGIEACMARGQGPVGLQRGLGVWSSRAGEMGNWKLWGEIITTWNNLRWEMWKVGFWGNNPGSVGGIRGFWSTHIGIWEWWGREGLEKQGLQNPVVRVNLFTAWNRTPKTMQESCTCAI